MKTLSNFGGPHNKLIQKRRTRNLASVSPLVFWLPAHCILLPPVFTLSFPQCGPFLILLTNAILLKQYHFQESTSYHKQLLNKCCFQAINWKHNKAASEVIQKFPFKDSVCSSKATTTNSNTSNYHGYWGRDWKYKSMTRKKKIKDLRGPDPEQQIRMLLFVF